MAWTLWRQKAKYSRVALDHEPVIEKPRSATTTTTTPKTVYLLVSLNLAILALLLIGGQIILHLHDLANPLKDTSSSSSPSRNIPIPLTHCGSTPTQARALGCLFESNNLAWVPPVCYDASLATEWDAQPWVYAVGPTQTPVSKERVLAGDLERVWVTWGQHVAHCALLVRKFQRAVMFNLPMDNWTSSLGHTEHCARSFTEWRFMREPERLNAVVVLKFPSCGYEWQEGIPVKGGSGSGSGGLIGGVV